MASSEERREVAKALRGDPAITLIDQTRDGFEGMTYHEAAYRFWDLCRRVMSVAKVDIAYSTTSVLADLIDPTCTYEPTETLNYWDEQDREHDTNQPDIECGTFSCSRCGNEMLYGDDGGWFDTEPPYAPLFMFCPGCGARVLPMVMRDRVVCDA